MNQRVLHWSDSINVRDLGGLPALDGRITRRKAIIRSDTPARLTAAGWESLYAYGIRSIITLQTYGMEEEELNFTSLYPDIETKKIAIEDVTDELFVQQWADTGLWSTPLYYMDALRRWPERHAAVISAIAQARPGGVLFHCIRGHDRTGIITLLLLSLAGVLPDEIITDYELSLDPRRDEILAGENTSVREVILNVLAVLDIEKCLLMGGVSPGELAIVHAHLLSR